MKRARWRSSGMDVSSSWASTGTATGSLSRSPATRRPVDSTPASVRQARCLPPSARKAPPPPPPSSPTATVNGLAIQPDGKLVAAGSAPLNVNGFLLARYKSDGSLDPSFGRDGKASTTFPTSSEDDLNAIALQRDGKIV